MLLLLTSKTNTMEIVFMDIKLIFELFESLDCAKKKSLLKALDAVKCVFLHICVCKIICICLVDRIGGINDI